MYVTYTKVGINRYLEYVTKPGFRAKCGSIVTAETLKNGKVCLNIEATDKKQKITDAKLIFLNKENDSHLEYINCGAIALLEHIFVGERTLKKIQHLIDFVSKTHAMEIQK